MANREKAAVKPVSAANHIADQVNAIRKKLGHVAEDWQPNDWLDTGNENVNAVFGHTEKGIPFGRILEVSGMESHGKTGLILNLAALAQAQGALVLWGDFESSYTEEWAAKRGLDPDGVALFSPYVGKFDGARNDPRQISGEEICEEIETTIKTLHKRYPRKLLVVDSIAAIQPRILEEAGLSGRNMLTKMALPMFMSSLLGDWVGLAQSHNTLMIFVNQLRQKPGMAFGDPWYTPGGNSTRFYAHVRVRMRRQGDKKGALMKSGRVIGIKGIAKNVKNKAGGREGAEIGYRLWHSGETEFVPAGEIKARGGEDAD